MMSHDASKRDFFNVFIDTKKSATYNYIKANIGCARSWILILRDAPYLAKLRRHQNRIEYEAGIQVGNFQKVFFVS
jgi:hypothetical protein